MFRIKPLFILCAALLTVTPAASEQKVPCMGSAAVLPVPGTRSVSLVLTGGAVTLSPVVLTVRWVHRTP